ncbi:hypothetical protein DQ04_20281000 [Trypanosoma grayi]|uniref:hypothetical protein n=1 Tax=Trypanosoma grayi TaxID=71804 RepID=UPI0004F47A91|nr:hypothetical protein DQ04_20281000 [Trypanosoma grayi]KEG05580.1 hypothetical protein DQ04_20281000 [Trypanosoma grayi]
MAFSAVFWSMRVQITYRAQLPSSLSFVSVADSSSVPLSLLLLSPLSSSDASEAPCRKHLSSRLCCAMLRSASASVMPVAIGNTTALSNDGAPASRSRSSIMSFVIWYSRLEPAALGWSLRMSPERPMPWARP